MRVHILERILISNQCFHLASGRLSNLCPSVAESEHGGITSAVSLSPTTRIPLFVDPPCLWRRVQVGDTREFSSPSPALPDIVQSSQNAAPICALPLRATPPKNM